MVFYVWSAPQITAQVAERSIASRYKRDALTDMYYTYILLSLKDSSYYVGHTGDLEKRLSRHNSKGSIFTKRKAPYKLVHCESFNTRGEAMKREIEIKSYKGGQAFKHLVDRLE